MAFEEFPDYEFGAVTAAGAAAAPAGATAIEATGDQLRATVRGMAAGARGKTWDLTGEMIAAQPDAWALGAARALAVGTRVQQVQAAMSRWEGTAPSQGELRAAGAKVAAARRQLEGAAGGPAAPQARAEAIAAEQCLLDLRNRRIAADEELVGAVEAATAGIGIPMRPASGPEGRPPSETAPGKPPPAPGTPGTGKPAGTGTPGGTPSAPATSLATGQTPTQAAHAAELAKPPTGPPVQLPPSLPQQAPALTPPAAPMAAPAAMAPAGSSGQRANSSRPPITTTDLDDVLPPAAPVAGLSAVSSPAPAPAPSPPSPTPTVSGTSTPGLTTTSDVAGRPEGSARTGLSHAAPEQQVGKQPGQSGQQTAGHGMGHPGGYIPPGAAGGPGPGTPAKKEDAPTVYSADHAALQGHEVLGESIPGGTICRPEGRAS